MSNNDACNLVLREASNACKIKLSEGKLKYRSYNVHDVYLKDKYGSSHFADRGFSGRNTV